MCSLLKSAKEVWVGGNKNTKKKTKKNERSGKQLIQVSLFRSQTQTRKVERKAPAAKATLAAIKEENIYKYIYIYI